MLRIFWLLVFLSAMLLPAFASAVCRKPQHVETTASVELLPGDLPVGCFGRDRTGTSAFKDPDSNAAKRRPDHNTIYKRDVVCISSDTITIDVPIYTNGGDLIVFADHVAITSFIDTRIYYSTDRFNKILPKSNDGWSSPLTTACDHPDYLPEIAALHDYYYSDCIDCVQRGTNSLVPRMPDGALVPFVDSKWAPNTVQYDGEPAPSYDALRRDALRSGSVSIYYRTFSATSPDIERLDYPCRLFFGETADFHFINTSGLYGGRGGPGSYGVVDPRNAGKSGAGGPGGDAGDVSFHQFGVSDEHKAARDALELLATFDGGVPGPSDSFRAQPSNVSPVASACYFVDPSRNVGRFDSASAGQSGHFTVTTNSITDAFSSFVFASLMLDNINEYDTVYSIEKSRSADRLTFGDHISITVGRSVGLQQAAVAKAFLDTVQGKPPQRQLRLGLFAELDDEQIATTKWPPLLSQMLAELRKLDGHPDGLLDEFLIRSGGLLNRQQSAPGLMGILSDLKAIALKSDATLESIRFEVALANTQDRQAALTARKGEIEATISQAKSDIARMIATIDAYLNKDPLDDLKTMASFMKSGIEMLMKVEQGDPSALTETFSMFERAQDANDKSSEQSAAFANAFAALPELRAQLLDAQRSLLAVASELDDARELARERERQSVIALNSGRIGLERRHLEAVLRFDELFRWIVAAYFRNTARDYDSLRANIDNLDRLINGADWATIDFSFPDLPPIHCTEGVGGSGCTTVYPTGERQVLDFSFATPDGGSVSLPAYVVSPQVENEISFSNQGFDLHMRTKPVDSAGAPACLTAHCSEVPSTSTDIIQLQLP